MTAWLERQAENGEVRRLRPEHYYALWVGPADQLVRGAIDSFGHFAKTDPGGFRSYLRESEDLLAEAAWRALKEPAG